MTARRVVIVAGPTASGKSGLALALADAFDGVVINADSMQVYRELPILTARPDAAALAAAPHRLYGVLSVADACSAGRWRDMALAEIAAAHDEGRLPILVGGTGLYLTALVEGIAAVPAVAQAVRAAVRAEYERLGAVAFHAALAARDPRAAARIAPTDRQRMIRAWEVLEATGRSLVDWQEGAPAASPGLAFAAILLDPPRDALYAAIERRFDGMMVAGALDEVRALMRMNLPAHLPALRAVGVADLSRHLAGGIALQDAVVQAKQATRRLAKRQVTWFRHHPLAARQIAIEEPPGRFSDAQFSESLNRRIFNFIRQFLLTR